MKVLHLTNNDSLGTPTNGGEQVNARDYRALNAVFGEENVFSINIVAGNLPQNRERHYYYPEDTSKFVRLSSCFTGRMNYIATVEKEIVERCVDISPDILLADGLYGRLVSKIKQRLKNLKVIIYCHNVEREYFRLRVQNEGKRILPLYFAAASNEKQATQISDWIVCLNERDRKELEQIYHCKVNAVIPPTFQDTFHPEQMKPEPAADKTLLFVGSFFPPNYDGISWFVKTVMPLLPQDYHLRIVGRNFETKRSELESERIQVIGSVDDLSAEFYSYPALVMPIRYGSGMKVKTAEAIMYGKRIFATDEALEGYDVEGVRGISRCNTPEEFAKAICDYFAAEENISMIEPEVRTLFKKKYSDQSAIQSFSKMLCV